MLTEHRAVTPLRVSLVLLFGMLLVLQTVSVPGQFADLADEAPELASLRWPLTVASVLVLLCAQVVVVATWRLLGLVRADRIFSEDARSWVDAIVRAIATAWVVLLGLAVLVGVRADDPAPVLLVSLLLVGVTVLGLLVVVMRALLRQATALRTDLEAVI